LARIENIVDLRIFEAIGRTRTLTGAAKDCGLSLTAVSRRLQQLEEVLELRLVQRSTRRLHLTPEGERFLENTRDILARLEEAENIASDKGTLRMTASVALSQRVIAPLLPRFFDLHQGVSVEMIASNDLMDLLQRRIDLAIRQEALEDSRLVARRIAPDARILCATPAYLSMAGTPEHPTDLERHRCLCVGIPARRSWTLISKSEQVEVPVRPILVDNNGEVIHAMALADGGIAIKSIWDVLDDLRSGRLVHVLPAWRDGVDRSIHLVLPERRYMPRRVRLFADFLAESLAEKIQKNADLCLWPNT
jgi:DNA-binding transcriptional LysR family regulator